MLMPSQAGVESAWTRSCPTLWNANRLHHDDVAVTPVPRPRSTANEAGQARVVGEMERSGRQVLASAVPRSGRESGHRGGDIGDGPVPKA
jgi:hypothetical protein